MVGGGARQGGAGNRHSRRRHHAGVRGEVLPGRQSDARPERASLPRRVPGHRWQVRHRVSEGLREFRAHPAPAAFVSLRGALRPGAAERPAIERAGGSAASAGRHRLSLAVALSAALLFASVSGTWALGKSPPPPPGPPPPTTPGAAAPAPTKSTGAPAATKPVEGAIPAPDIPLEADKLITTLRSLEDRGAPSPTLQAIEAGLPDMAQRISDAQVETKGYLSATSSMTALTNLSDLWAGLQADLKTWADQLRVRATDVGTVLDELED